jgi:hypothetical protein
MTNEERQMGRVRFRLAEWLLRVASQESCEIVAGERIFDEIAADYAVFRDDAPERPWLVIEVIESDAKAGETLARLSRWRSYGVDHILLAQPSTRTLYHRTGDTLRMPDRWDLGGGIPSLLAQVLFEV